MNDGSMCGGINGRIGSAALFFSLGLLSFTAASILIDDIIVTVSLSPFLSLFHCCCSKDYIRVFIMNNTTVVLLPRRDPSNCNVISMDHRFILLVGCTRNRLVMVDF